MGVVCRAPHSPGSPGSAEHPCMAAQGGTVGTLSASTTVLLPAGLGPYYKTKCFSFRQASVVSLARWPVAGICLLFPCSDLFTLLEHIPNIILCPLLVQLPLLSPYLCSSAAPVSSIPLE